MALSRNKSGRRVATLTPEQAASRARWRMGAAGFAAATTMVACLGGVFALSAATFPWVTVITPTDATGGRPVAAKASPVIVRDANQTPAAKALAAVLDMTPRTLATQDWVAADRATNVAVVDVGFGCDAKEGISPAVSLTQNWVPGTTASTTQAGDVFSVTAQGFPAGAGAVAFVGLRDAVTACGTAAWYPVTGLGVEAAEIDAGRATTLVWRRGDALMVATAASDGNTTAVEPYAAAAREIDQALKQALVGVCADPTAGADQATRSPFINREDYRGYGSTVTVRRDPMPSEETAEYLARISGVRTYPIPPAAVALPVLATLPATPIPAPTKGPTTLPALVVSPTAPVAPTDPAKTRKVLKAEPDHVGPGCGWGFTGQQAPKFDSDAADEQHTDDLAAAQMAMQDAWQTWQQARLRFYTAWKTYLQAAKDYSAYAEEVSAVAEAWAVIDQARTAYETALAAYEAAVTARETFKVDKKTAKREYRAAKNACRDNDPQAKDDPTTTPTLVPSPTSSPSATATSEPTAPTSAPQPVCPPPVPPILNQRPPQVPESPTPAAEAQLPVPTASTTP